MPSSAAITSKPHQFVSDINTTTNNNYIALSWSEIWEKLKRKKVAGGSRGLPNNLCLVAPSKLINLESPDNTATNSLEFWHQNPLFVWQSGELNKIVLQDETGLNKWEKIIKPSSTHLFYDGKPLQLGKTYKLVVFAPYETEIYSIQVVSADKHQQIKAELTEKQLETKSLNQEQIALVKANYFIAKQMWLDVFWELYSIPNPTNELKNTLEQINTHNFCPH